MYLVKNMILLGILFSVSNAMALIITDERGSVEVEVPKNWKYERDLLGLPHVFLGPGESKRVSVSLTLTGIEDVNLPVKDLQKNQKQYQNGRTAWAKQRGLTITEFHPYKQRFTLNKEKIHEIGVEYKDREETQVEISYYIECPASFVHMKSLGAKNSPELKEAETIVKSLKCKK